MKVIVKLLATYRKLLPPEAEGNRVEVEILEGTTITDLMARFGVPLSDDSVFLVNGLTPKSLDQELVDGDVLAAFSAMAGG
jgi:molybdopterin converting factor small subunit